MECMGFRLNQIGILIHHDRKTLILKIKKLVSHDGSYL